MAESTTFFCEPCEHDGIIKSSDTWYNNCRQGFCTQCVKSHESINVLRNREITPVFDHFTTNEFILNQICSVHDKELKFFCCQHDKVICLKCVQSQHSKCDDVMEVEKASESVQESTALVDLEENISIFLSNVVSLLERQSENINSLKGQKRTIRQGIKDIRKKIDIYLDQLQAKLLEELNSRYSTSIAEMNKIENELKQKELQICKINEQNSKVKDLVSNVHTFIAMKNTEKIIFTEKESLVKEIGHLKKYHLEFNVNSELNSLFQNLKAFGEIAVDSESVPITYIEPKSQQAQHEVSLVNSSIDNIQLEMIQTFAVHKYKFFLFREDVLLSGCAILTNKQMVFADNKSKTLIIHNESGTYSHEFILPESPRYITTIDNNKVAVSYGYPNKTIDIVNISTYKVEKTITGCIEYDSYGISYDGGKLYFVDGGIEIKEITLDGQVTNTIPVNTTGVYNITTHKDRIYYTAYNNTVYCCGKTGKRIWTFCDDSIKIGWPSAPITADTHGNIIVAGSDTNVIMVISHDGQNHKVLDKSDKINTPAGIFYAKEGNQLLFCNYYDGHATLFNVKS